MIVLIQILLAALCLSVQFLTLYILVAGNFLQNIFYSLILLLTSFSIVYSLICLWDSLGKNYDDYFFYYYYFLSQDMVYWNGYPQVI